MSLSMSDNQHAQHGHTRWTDKVSSPILAGLDNALITGLDNALAERLERTVTLLHLSMSHPDLIHTMHWKDSPLCPINVKKCSHFQHKQKQLSSENFRSISWLSRTTGSRLKACLFWLETLASFSHRLLSTIYFFFFLNQTILCCDQVQLNIVNYSKCWQSVVNSPKLNQLRMQSNSAKPAVGKSQAKVKKLFVKIQSTTGQLE